MSNAEGTETKGGGVAPPDLDQLESDAAGDAPGMRRKPMRRFAPRGLPVTNDMTHEMIWSADLMIRRARSLGRLVEEIEKARGHRGSADALLFEGSSVAVPVLLSLATEIALKAWQYRERNGAPDRTHDLLELFDGLGDSAQKRLRERMPEIDDPLMPPIYRGMRSVLSQSSRMFVEWRYPHEHGSLWADTGPLKMALDAIIAAYDESPKDVGPGT